MKTCSKGIYGFLDQKENANKIELLLDLNLAWHGVMGGKKELWRPELTSSVGEARA